MGTPHLARLRRGRDSREVLDVLGQVLDHLHDLATVVAVLSGELDQVPDLGDYGTLRGRAGDP